MQVKVIYSAGSLAQYLARGKACTLLENLTDDAIA